MQGRGKFKIALCINNATHRQSYYLFPEWLYMCTRENSSTVGILVPIRPLSVCSVVYKGIKYLNRCS